MARTRNKPTRTKHGKVVAAGAPAAMAPGPVFKLELDLHLFCEPLMDEEGDGIVVSKTLELPFPPYEGLALIGKQIDESPGPRDSH